MCVKSMVKSAILMEYVEGQSLSVLLKDRPLTWAETWQVIADFVHLPYLMLTIRVIRVQAPLSPIRTRISNLRICCCLHLVQSNC